MHPLAGEPTPLKFRAQRPEIEGTHKVAVSSKSSEAEPEVRTVAGLIRGGREAGLAVFRGISYAEPPVGALRFAAPEPVRSWDGVRPAVAFGPPPPQSSFLGASRDIDGDDWLTINVWTPDPDPAAGLPVMVWIPGGGYVMADAGLPEYDGGRLARTGIVLVTLNYRVGFEGFAQIKGAPANRGLLDQVAALEWVRDNIGVFGGDPGRVTVFGQSAGGGSVAALLVMPRAAGLFGRAVAQSVPGTFFSPELAADITAAFAAELGHTPTVPGLSAVAPARLLPGVGDEIVPKLVKAGERWGKITHRRIPFAPVVDGDVLPATPWQALADGAARDIELLVGHTRDEHRLFSLINGVLGQVTHKQTETALHMLAPEPDGARRYREAFPAATDEELYELVNADWLFRMPSLHLADAQIAGGGQAHLYELTWPAPGMDGLGACHGLDIPLVFGNLASGQPAMLIGDPPSPAAEELSEQIRTAWTAFATSGSPGWAPYNADRRLTQLFDTPSTVTAYPEETSRLLWQDRTFPALPLLTT